MALVTQAYNSQKIALLHQVLAADAEEGRPREYDISVDDLKVVRRTEDPERFFLHEDFIVGDTKAVVVTIYEGSSKRNMRYLFTLKGAGVPEDDKATLSGLEGAMTEKMAQQKKAWEYEQLQKELQELKEEMDEQEAYVEKLEGLLREEREKKVSIKDSWGDVVSVALEGMMRRNAHLLNGVPLIGEGLAGAITEDNKRLETAASGAPSLFEQETAVSFKRAPKQTSEEESPGEGRLHSPLSKDARETLRYVNVLRDHFSGEELADVFEIIGRLSQAKENIAEVLDLLKGDEIEENEPLSKEGLPF